MLQSSISGAQVAARAHHCASVLIGESGETAAPRVSTGYTLLQSAHIHYWGIQKRATRLSNTQKEFYRYRSKGYFHSWVGLVTSLAMRSS
uniref:Uncharacterized protein n=1 Tax=Knipowitschia caucasica TaxID=637954 RepID=A0AAV2KQD1_KNICA